MLLCESYDVAIIMNIIIIAWTSQVVCILFMFSRTSRLVSVKCYKLQLLIVTLLDESVSQIHYS